MGHLAHMQKVPSFALPFLTFYFLTLSYAETPKSRRTNIFQRGHHHCLIIKLYSMLILGRNSVFHFMCLKWNLHLVIRLRGNDEEKSPVDVLRNGRSTLFGQ